MSCVYWDNLSIQSFPARPGACLTKPHGATNGAHDPNEEITEPWYAQFYIFPPNQPFVAVCNRIYNTCRLVSEPLPYLTIALTTITCMNAYIHACLKDQILRIHSPYLTYAFAYQPYTAARINFTISMTRYARYYSSSCTILTRVVSDEWRYESTAYHVSYITYTIQLNYCCLIKIVT